MHVLRGFTTIAHGENDSRSATNDVATGIDIRPRRLHLLVDCNRVFPSKLKPFYRLGDKRVGGYPDGYDDLIDRKCDGLSLYGNRRPPPTGIGLAKLHHLKDGRTDGTILISLVLNGIVQGEEVDTLFLCMFHFFETCGHLGLGAAIDKCHVGTEPLGCATGVHCSIAATDNQHMFAEVHRRVARRVGGIHEVDTGQILV